MIFRNGIRGLKMDKIQGLPNGKFDGEHDFFTRWMEWLWKCLCRYWSYSMYPLVI